MYLDQRLKASVRSIGRSVYRRLRPEVLPDWRALLGADGDRFREASSAARGPSVLIATNVGWFRTGTAVEAMLAAALTLRGARVQFALCDKVLPVCLAAEFHRFPDPERIVAEGVRRKLCDDCYGPTADSFATLGLPVLRFSEFLTPEARAAARETAARLPAEELAGYRDAEGLAIGEQALSGAIRYFARGDITLEPLAEPVLRRFIEAALLSAAAMRGILAGGRFEVVCLHHGIYVPQGLAVEVARARGVRVVTWNPAYRKKCFIFAHGATYNHTLLEEPVELWEDLPFDAHMERQVVSYLESRWTGGQDWIGYFDRPLSDPDRIMSTLGVDPSRPCVGLLSNVGWDARLFYAASVFTTMVDWVLETIRYFVRRPDLQLVIRVHPAEVRGTLPARDPLASEIRRAFPALPRNVFVVPPESNVSTYAIMQRCSTALIYGTKMGVELSSMGMPVVVAGEAWIRGKGFTHDASTREEYTALLDRLPLPRLDEAAVRRARKYAFHFFFRRMIPLASVERGTGPTPFVIKIAGLADLAPGADPGLDLVCEGILSGTPFLYPAERTPAGATACAPA